MATHKLLGILERIILGTAMGLALFVVERQMNRKRSGRQGTVKNSVKGDHVM